MSFSTFSGPVRAGTVRDGTIAGGRNTGSVVLAQVYDSGDITGTVVGNVDVQIGNLPKGAVITDIQINQVVAATVGTTTISVGNATGGAQLMAAVATTAGGIFRGTATAATQLAWVTSTTADTTLFVRNAVAVGALGAGRFLVTVTYIQRSDAATMNP
jgi:hypothetical protein